MKLCMLKLYAHTTRKVNNKIIEKCTLEDLVPTSGEILFKFGTHYIIFMTIFEKPVVTHNYFIKC